MGKIIPAKQKIKPSAHEKLIEKIGQAVFTEKIATMSISEIAEVATLFDEWVVGEVVSDGVYRYYDGQLYECIQAHTTQADWTPDITGSLWVVKSTEDISDWVQPTGAQDAYQIGDQVQFNGHVYESLINANVWSPTAYPAGWQLVE